jgi:CDGSH iron-sulfur domain-containing protein 3
MSDAPHIAQTAPYKVDLQGEKSYFWCACGQSKNQPYCDGSHKGTSFTPLKFDVEAAKTAFLCGCKHTANAPFCDGSHKALTLPTA